MVFFRRLSYAILVLAGVHGLIAQTVNCPQKPQPDCCFYQGDALLGCQCKPAYNLPAAIAVTNKWCGCYTVFIDASFIYWHADEEGLEVARSAPISPTGAILLPQHRVFLSQDFEYKPGFKVGAGITGENQWMLYSEYTWIRDRMSQSNSTPPPPDFAVDRGVWAPTSWFEQSTATGGLIGANAVSSTWHLNMDLADLNLSRPFYQGRALTIAPFAGLQAAWIRQSMVVAIHVAPESFGAGNLLPQPISSVNRSHCWGIGPKIGCNGYCLFPMGFRLQGNASAAVLYTRYTKVVRKENGASTLFSPGPYKAQLTDYNCLRPISELGLGIGWGSYLSCQNYHIDFSATYDFLIFWQQNMMRKLADMGESSLGNAPLDLHLHGLTLTGRFDF